MYFKLMREICTEADIDLLGLQSGLALAIDAIVPEADSTEIARLTVDHAVSELLELWLLEPDQRERFNSAEWLSRFTLNSVGAFLAGKDDET